jgi:hypothetical protein
VAKQEILYTVGVNENYGNNFPLWKAVWDFSKSQRKKYHMIK